MELGHLNLRIPAIVIQLSLRALGYIWQEKIEISITKVYNANGVTFIHKLNYCNG